MVICPEQSAIDLHMIQFMLLPSHHLLFIKIQNTLPLWYRLTR